jgi:hypothetical protein
MQQQEPIIIYDHLHEEENKKLYHPKRSLMINRYIAFLLEEIIIVAVAAFVILSL